ncbi:PIN domain-containing protein [candidate division WWE3 bacterium]|nr:PIN domain-containing protein [candidate division WWE3 bacterium]
MPEILLDTNILIFSINENDLLNQQAREFINLHLPQLALADQNINEAIRVLTHEKYKKTASLKDAMEAVKRVSDLCIHISPNIYTREHFFRLLKKYKVTSNKIYDAYLVATALSNSIYKIATNNVKDFEVFEEMELVKF